MSVTLIQEDNLQDALIRALALVMKCGKDVIGNFNTQAETKELNPCVIEISNPKRRTLLCPKRGNNPFATLAETYWILAGRSDVGFLMPFMPRAADFSDDGQVWRAGYGPRIMSWPVHGATETSTTNQLHYVLKQLIKDRACRQAVVSLWDPAKENTIEKTKDYPCCNWIHFLVRENRLNLTLVMRSNDIIWGWSHINMYEWSVIQEVIAKCLSINIGTYYQLSDSFHIYKHSYEKANLIVDNAIEYSNFYELPTFEFCDYQHTFVGTPHTYLDLYLGACSNMCIEISSGMEHIPSGEYADIDTSFKLLKMYKENAGEKKIAWSNYSEVMKSIPFSDLKVACHYWYVKNIRGEQDKGMETIQKCITEMKYLT